MSSLAPWSISSLRPPCFLLSGCPEYHRPWWCDQEEGRESRHSGRSSLSLSKIVAGGRSLSRTSAPVQPLPGCRCLPAAGLQLAQPVLLTLRSGKIPQDALPYRIAHGGCWSSPYSPADQSEVQRHLLEAGCRAMPLEIGGINHQYLFCLCAIGSRQLGEDQGKIPLPDRRRKHLWESL